MCFYKDYETYGVLRLSRKEWLDNIHIHLLDVLTQGKLQL